MQKASGTRVIPGDDRKLEELMAVLVATASGDFDVRASRSYSGDAWDVLAYLVNETSEEVKHLVAELHSERQQLIEARDRLHHTEKLAALGELAGGVAHELNQPLTVIQTLAEVLLAQPKAGVEQGRKQLELIEAASKRMGRIVAAVRTFGRKAPISRTPIDVAEPLCASLALLEDSLTTAGIEVSVSLAKDTPIIDGNSDVLQQVFINLLSNCRDALEELGPDEPRRVDVELARSEAGVRVTIRDNGPGVPEEYASRLFDPFFSTKGNWRGTGLGLSISHGIVGDHGGTLSYRPAPGGGAEFVLEFQPQDESDTQPQAPRS